MNTPTAALAWEFWRRHRQRLIIIAALLLGFIFVYPLMCATAGFNPDSPDATNEFARLMMPNLSQPTPLHIIQVLYIIFLVGGPVTAMVLSLLCVVWMFTLTEVDLETRNPLAFPVRRFTLPVSTPFLFWRIISGGLIAILGLTTAWSHGVHLPHFETFNGYQSCFAWMTLMVLAQGIIWALAAWPFTRMVALGGLLLLMLAAPSQPGLFESPVALAPLFLSGILLARISLQKMRQGEWQGRTWYHWQSRFTHWLARPQMRGPRQFSSPAQAQLWFEWRRSAARLCLVTAILVLLPAVFFALRAALGYDPLQADTLTGVTCVLFLAPLVIFGLHSISPMRSDLPFMFTRPLTSGAIVTSILKSISISVLLSWGAVLVALAILNWVGNYHPLTQLISSFPGRRAALVIGLLFLTGRFAVINLSFVLTENQRLSQAPVWLMFLIGLAGAGIFMLGQTGVPFGWLLNHLSAWAAALIAVKFLLAFQVYRTALKRRLLTRSAITGYLVAWSLLVTALLGTLLFLVKPDPEVMLPACLAVVLLVPITRIGVAPFALAWARHVSGGPTSRWPEFRWRSPRA